MSITKPFLKWVGGKTQILDNVLETFPKSFNDYFEPFVGGGSVLLAVLSLRKQGKLEIRGNVYASDLNWNLIGLYKNIQQHCELLLTEIKLLVQQYTECKETGVNRSPKTLEEGMSSQESYYYWIRSQFNSLSMKDRASVKGSAMLLFLNKTCFRGVYREGPNGINVPFGHYKNPSVIDEDHIREVRELIQDVTFWYCSFEKVLKIIEKGDFIYVDPPYVPESATSFVSYVADGFDKHELLFEQLKKAHTCEVKFVMSNANVPLVCDSFSNEAYTIKTIDVRRAIHSKDPSAKTKEVIIMN